jgi:hypothetical protein
MRPEIDVPMVPRCGLYRTARPVPGHEQEIPASRLVYFHNHSAEGPPIVLLPVSNERNRWHFHRQGCLIPDLAYLATLEPLKAEGLYRLREHFHAGDEQIVNRNALAQLGYTIQAEPILFFPMMHTTDNSLVFPERGLRIDDAIYGLLEPLDLRGPHTPDTPHLH